MKKDLIHCLIFFFASALVGVVATMLYIDRFFMANVSYEVEINDLSKGTMIMYGRDPITNEKYVVKADHVYVTVAWHKERMTECRFNLIKGCSRVY